MWHHVAVVVEAGVGQRIYVDGIMVASGSKDYSDFGWDNTLNIGFANDWFAGSIDNVRLWSVVRTQTEIEQDQTLHVIGSFPGLIGNWDLMTLTDLRPTILLTIRNVFLLMAQLSLKTIRTLIYGVQAILQEASLRFRPEV